MSAANSAAQLIAQHGAGQHVLDDLYLGMNRGMEQVDQRLQRRC